MFANNNDYFGDSRASRASAKVRVTAETGGDGRRRAAHLVGGKLIFEEATNRQ